LTPRERELLNLLAGGMSRTQELADTMYISQKTVKNHLSSIFEKLGVPTRAEAIVEAFRLGIVAVPSDLAQPNGWKDDSNDLFSSG
jgi:DNA-binding CsgD family transcriptional regulator